MWSTILIGTHELLLSWSPPPPPPLYTPATQASTKLHNMVAISQLIGCQDMQPWLIMYIFDLRHLCYGQLTHVKTRYTAWLHLCITEIGKDSLLTLYLFGINK